jgi:NitT/TauT family transport system substrate-binding protein
LKALQTAGAFGNEKVAIAPIRSAPSAGGGQVEVDPLLSKDIRFFFEPNSAKLDVNNQDNLKHLADIKQLLQVSPGSTLLLRGHVDNSQIEEFRRKGGEELVRTQGLRAMELSKQRAAEIKRLLVEREKVDASRIDPVGRGWLEPAGTNPDENRRVEVQWFTLE